MTDETADNPQIKGYREFEFDLPGALLDHLVRALDEMETAPLRADSLAVVPEAQGVYQLFLYDHLVYIGKTDAEAGLFKRLTRHSRKILHRIGLDPSRVGFKAIRIFVFTAMDLETQLIKRYSAVARADWNGSGFGSNDPGRERDTQQPSRFDQEYPIDIDRILETDFSGAQSAAEVAGMLKSELPFTFRYQMQRSRARTPHPDLTDTVVTISDGPKSAREVIAELVNQLPQGWQATALSAVLILYKEVADTYPQATVLARS